MSCLKMFAFPKRDKSLADLAGKSRDTDEAFS